MTKARNAIRSDAACHSADVLTPTERAVEMSRTRRTKPSPAFVKPEELVYREKVMQWGDVPEIRMLLSRIRGKS